MSTSSDLLSATSLVSTVGSDTENDVSIFGGVPAETGTLTFTTCRPTLIGVTVV